MSKGCYVVVDGTTKKVKKKYVVVDGVTKKVKKKYVVVENFAPVSLPTGYTQVEYVESNGNQYVDTGLTPSATNNKIVLSFIPAASGTGTILGSSAGASQDAITITTREIWIAGAKAFSKTYSTDAVNEFELQTVNGAYTLTCNGTTTTASSSNAMPATANYYIFAQNQGGSVAQKSSVKIYNAKIYKDGTLVRNYVPCKNASGVVGLYDLVNSSFISSATSTALAAGAEQGNATRLVYELIEKPVASTTPASGVSYTNGLSGLTAAQVSSFAETISNNTDITNTTSAVYIDHNDIHRKLSIGDQVTLALNGTNYAFDIIGFNHDTLTTSTAYGASTATGRAGITMQMHDMFATTYAMNSSDTNYGGWKSSQMRTSTMATMKGYLPSAWQTIIKPVNKNTGTGGGSMSGTETVSDSCFLLAEVEIFGSTSHSVAGEGLQYAYYRAGNSKVKKKSGSAYYWWERSPGRGSSSSFWAVNSDGGAYGFNASYIYGVAFAFCV